ncbi:isoprenoid synthase domain-containing protein [Aspergillus alliaceus]|uniref:Isoprenoid synthase domain-containing protein n=1 Tax=Petromyces alliaceus TaxID=209559 RepID=A0A5N7BZ46_PETAA|nr:isoprenoid synthase domain-containing protein [Aspergillus alliaceus]
MLFFILISLDDVQDNSPLRRSQPAAHTIFGVRQTVNSATYKIVDVISQAARLPAASEIVPFVLEGMAELMRGQGLDLLWTHQVLTPSTGDYIRMIDGKTGGLFRMIPQLMIATSSSSDGISDVISPLERFMTLLGRYFQIRDDYANLASDKYSISKGFCEDLDEGKCSFVLHHALNHSSPSAREILRHMTFQRRAAGHAERAQKELMLRLMKEAGSLNHTLHVLGLLQHEILVELDKIEAHTGTPNLLLRQLINALAV